jgi:hypothetical protein
MSIGVSVRTTKFAARNNGSVARQESNPQSELHIVPSVTTPCSCTIVSPRSCTIVLRSIIYRFFHQLPCFCAKSGKQFSVLQRLFL